MTTGRPITEEDLHAYVDDALDLIRRDEVEAYLQQHPDVARCVQGYTGQRAELRAMLSPIAEEPVPPELSLANLAKTHRPSYTTSWRTIAAAILILSLGSAGGWTMHGMSRTQPSGIAILAHEAAYSYTVYSPDNLHPVEFSAADQGKYTDWISQRLNTPITIPDLSRSGYHFMGGRLVATEYGPAGLLMYDNGHGLRLVMLVRQMAEDKNTSTMSQSSEGTVTGFTWARGGVGYSVACATSPDVLHPIANEIRKQINLDI